MTWRSEDTETAVCCLCGLTGVPVFDVDPFGIVRCGRCDLVFVSPRLTSDALSRLYCDPGYHGAMYDGSPGAMFLQRTWMAGRLKLALREFGRPPREGRLLEVGSGRGMFLHAARIAGFAVTGVELSHPAATHARDEYGLTVHSAQLGDAPLDGPYDVICAWDTLEHVPDPVDFWRSVDKLLAPGGVVLFSTPYFSSLPSRLLRRRWWTLKPAEHIWQFTPDTHRAVAAAAGLTITAIHRSALRRMNFARPDSLVGVARAA